MSRQAEIVKAYSEALSKCNYQELMNVFSPDAVMHTPHYGKLQPAVHYKKLLDKAKSVNMVLKNVCVGIDDANVVVGHYISNWFMKDGSSTGDIEWLCLFKLNSKHDKIVSLSQFYNNPTAETVFNKWSSSLT